MPPPSRAREYGAGFELRDDTNHGDRVVVVRDPRDGVLYDSGGRIILPHETDVVEAILIRPPSTSIQSETASE